MTNVEIVRAAYEGMLTGEMEPMIALLGTDIEWYSAEHNPTGGVHVGRDAVVRDLFGRLPEVWDGFECTPMRFHDAGDSVIVEARYTATSRETGRKLDAQACHVWNLSDGTAVSFRQYTDTAQFLAALDLGLATVAGGS